MSRITRGHRWYVYTIEHGLEVRLGTIKAKEQHTAMDNASKRWPDVGHLIVKNAVTVRKLNGK